MGDILPMASVRTTSLAVDLTHGHLVAIIVAHRMSDTPPLLTTSDSTNTLLPT
jgi:hypothetical protein